MKVLLPALTALLVAQSATTLQAECLDDATNFTLKLCGELNNSGTRTELVGKADAEASISKWLSGLLKLSGKVGGETEVEKYVGPVRDQLTQDRFNALNCRAEMAKVAIQTQCNKRVDFKTCPRPEFDINHWESTAEREGNSGWRKGGHTQAEWCGELAATALRENNVTPAHTWKTLWSDEDITNDWGTEKYNYKCKVQIQWGPVYNVRADPLCGIQSSDN